MSYEAKCALFSFGHKRIASRFDNRHDVFWHADSEGLLTVKLCRLRLAEVPSTSLGPAALMTHFLFWIGRSIPALAAVPARGQCSLALLFIPEARMDAGMDGGPNPAVCRASHSTRCHFCLYCHLPSYSNVCAWRLICFYFNSELIELDLSLFSGRDIFKKLPFTCKLYFSEKSLALSMFSDCNHLRKKYASANYLIFSEILFFCCCSPAVVDNLKCF